MIGPVDFKPKIKLDFAKLAAAQEAEVEVCNGCNESTRHVGEDGISVCENCGVVEGETRMVTEAEYERLNA